MASVDWPEGWDALHGKVRQDQGVRRRLWGRGWGRELAQAPVRRSTQFRGYSLRDLPCRGVELGRNRVFANLNRV